jgi:hypothetical protein
MNPQLRKVKLYSALSLSVSPLSSVAVGSEWSESDGTSRALL